jgi:hypothetical protein
MSFGGWPFAIRQITDKTYLKKRESPSINPSASGEHIIGQRISRSPGPTENACLPLTCLSSSDNLEYQISRVGYAWAARQTGRSSKIFTDNQNL